jgi:hypothetical protein
MLMRRLVTTMVLLLVWSLSTPGLLWAQLDDVCLPQYRAVSEHIERLAIRAGRVSAERKVEDAWRRALLGDSFNKAVAAKLLLAARSQLRMEYRSAGVPFDDMSRFAILTSQLGECILAKPDAPTAMLTVRTFFMDDSSRLQGRAGRRRRDHLGRRGTGRHHRHPGRGDRAGAGPGDAGGGTADSQ